MTDPNPPADRRSPTGVEDTLGASAVDPGLERTQASADPGEAETLDGRAAPLGPATAIGLQRGDRLGRYEIVEVLGAGGMGVVYAGYDPELKRPVALKLLSTRALQGDSGSDARARLLREAQALARLSHPNVVAVYDVGTWSEQVYVAMEKVEGETLGIWLRSQRRRPHEIMSVFDQAARGLAAAHDAGLVHRDFKPDNVLVGRDGRVRVMDFGLARSHGTEDRTPSAGAAPAVEAAGPTAVLAAHLTRTGALLGTPAYMSPEQFAGRATDARTDQFSFAVALYEAFHGQRPFAGDTLQSLSEAVQAGRRPTCPISSGVPPWLCGVLDRALATDPSDRFPSMQALLDTLERGRRTRQRHRWMAGGALVALIAVVAGGLFLRHVERKGRREQDRSAAAARKEREAEQARVARLAKHFDALRERRTTLLAEVATTTDQARREELLCQAAGLEDVIATPGKSVTAAAIRATLKRCFPVITRCYRSILTEAPGAQGTIKIQYETDEQGVITGITFPVDEIRIPALTDCLRAKMSRWRFPTGGSGEKMVVAYPFHFKP